MKDNSRPVYSSAHGRLCPDCGHPLAACRCRQEKPPSAGDGIVRVRRESKGRGGKTVTVITGFSLEQESVQRLAAELKRRCGSGGTVREGAIEIQGDHGNLLIAELQQRGFKVKRAGG